MVVLLFIVLVIVLPGNINTHLKYAARLAQEGQIARGTVYEIDPHDPGRIVVQFDTPDEPGRIAFVDTRYYRPVDLDGLKVGDPIRLRYLPSPGEVWVVWEEHYDQVVAYNGYWLQPLLILLACWVLIILRPEILLVGYISWPELTRKVKEHS